LAVRETEDEAERLGAELALAILLLAHNYELAPADYFTLLSFAPGDPALAAMQGAFRAVASAHVQRLEARRQAGDSASISAEPRPLFIRMATGVWWLGS
jgi:hypothetical protein